MMMSPNTLNGTKSNKQNMAQHRNEGEMSKLDLFFYEELSIIAGHDIGSQWLRDISASRKRKASSDFFSSNKKAADSSFADKHRINPEVTILAENRAFNVYSDRLSSPLRDSFQSPWIDLDSLSKQPQSSCRPDHIWRSDIINKIDFLSDRDESAMGLIFTDAAHTVLE